MGSGNPSLVRAGDLVITDAFRDNATFTTVLGPTSIPEPGTFGLMGLGLAGVGFMRRKRKR